MTDVAFGEKIEIGRATLQFRRGPDGGISMGIYGSGFHAMYQIAVGLNGQPLAVVPFVGMGAPFPPYPKPSILAWIQSDEQGMWGRRCPFCKAYFRTIHVSTQTCCPYCSNSADSLAFITEMQGRYVEAFCNAWIKAYQGPDDVVIDLAAITDSNPEWDYLEEKQQYQFTCPSCQTSADILGNYGYCPCCGRTNAHEVIAPKLTDLEGALDTVDKTIADRAARANEWEGINTRCFTEIETLGNHLRKRLLLFPATPARRTDLENLSFQRLAEASEKLGDWFGIDLFKGISPAEQSFVGLMLQRRHIVMHNGGIVDEDYLRKSGDTGARLHQRIHIRSKEIRRLLPLVRSICVNLLQDFQSLT